MCGWEFESGQCDTTPNNNTEIHPALKSLSLLQDVTCVSQAQHPSFLSYQPSIFNAKQTIAGTGVRILVQTLPERLAEGQYWFFLWCLADSDLSTLRGCLEEAAVPGFLVSK